MASTSVRQKNGAVQANGNVFHPRSARFSDIPAVIDIPVRGEDGDEAVNLDLTELLDETDELCDLLENENAARNHWITIALAYAKQDKVNIAIDILHKGLKALSRSKDEDRLNILSCICWLYLWKCRHAPRVKPSQQAPGQEVDGKLKEHWLQQATATLNEASRISPSYPPLFLARGTLYLLHASLQAQRYTHGSQDYSERTETIKQASKCFDDAYRASEGKNIMAVMGKARANFSLGAFAAALELYQQALERAPDMIDPDPRIGIGCCLWNLGHKGPAKAAWQRSMDLTEGSAVAHVLLGLCYLDESNHFNVKDERFAVTYRKAMTECTQPAFKLDPMSPLVCATFGDYFLRRKNFQNVERLARRAIEYTDVNGIASDGWYLLARKDHYEGDMSRASDEYAKADQARGGDERGFLPAKFGAAQLKVLMHDLDGAKFRLEKIVEKNKNIEAMTLLGILHAEDVFASQLSGSKEDKTVEIRRAVSLLEQVRLVWKDSAKNYSPDKAVLLTLARLYEADHPEKALACLEHVQEMELAIFSDDDSPDEDADQGQQRRMKRELLSPHLLNNIGCLHFKAEKFHEAREDFQTALNSCVKLPERMSEEDVDTDALVSTISYNLARTYEAEKIYDEARNVYQGLLGRHPRYLDANARLAYLTYKADPVEGAAAIKNLMEADPANLEIRGLYGWYINRAKKRTPHLNEDQEQRHYKQTLQAYDKHDLYALTGMGNLHLLNARDTPRTDAFKERRSKTYIRAVEFFDKVLSLDPKNAYAAQGLGIAVVEEKRDTSAAIQIFTRVRESIKDACVNINLGHAFTEAKQFNRAIENYELALAKLGTRDPTILTCLGRTWLLRGRQENALEAYKTSLDFSRQALEAMPDNIAFQFNVALVQIQMAQVVATLPESQKMVVDVESAAEGLDQAIETFVKIAQAPNPPFPRGHLEQRANMGRNTIKKQVAAAIERQSEYQKRNATRYEEAMKRREEEIQRKMEEKRIADEKADEERRRVKESRDKIIELDQELIERQLATSRLRADRLAARRTRVPGEDKKKTKKPKREKGKRKKKDDAGSGDEGSHSGSSHAGSGDEHPEPKRRRLERNAKPKYKSLEIVEDSSDEDGGVGADSGETADQDKSADGTEDEVDSGAAHKGSSQRKNNAMVVDDDDEEEDEIANGTGVEHDGDEMESS